MSVQNRKSFAINRMIFAIPLAVYAFLTLFLFHRQSVNYNGQYISDFYFYVGTINGSDMGFHFPYPVMFVIGRLLHLFLPANHALVITVAGLNLLAVLFTKYYFDRFLNVAADGSWKKSLFSTLLTFSAFLSSMLFPLTYLGRYQEAVNGRQFLYRYLGTFSPNPYHNATFLAMRPFSIPTFFLLTELLGKYEKEDTWYTPKRLLFAAFLLLSTMTKPTFTLVFAAAAGLVMLLRLIRSGKKGWKPFWQLGIYFIPTFLDLLYQYKDVFTGTSDTEGIGFGFFTVWSALCKNIPLAVAMAILFPAVLLCLNPREALSDPVLRFAWQFYIVSFLSFALLYENGPRIYHANFSWGYMSGLFFLHLASLLFLARKTLRTKSKTLPLHVIAPWIVFGLHLICGIDYFRILMAGGLFH